MSFFEEIKLTSFKIHRVQRAIQEKVSPLPTPPLPFPLPTRSLYCLVCVCQRCCVHLQRKKNIYSLLPLVNTLVVNHSQFHSFCYFFILCTLAIFPNQYQKSPCNFFFWLHTIPLSRHTIFYVTSFLGKWF